MSGGIDYDSILNNNTHTHTVMKASEWLARRGCKVLFFYLFPLVFLSHVVVSCKGWLSMA